MVSEADELLLKDVKLYMPSSSDWSSTLEALYKQSPEAALEYAFRCGKDSIWGNTWIYTEHEGTDGRWWGGCKVVSRDDLKDRTYTLYITDTWPKRLGIVFTDKLFDPRTRTLVDRG